MQISVPSSLWRRKYCSDFAAVSIMYARSNDVVSSAHELLITVLHTHTYTHRHAQSLLQVHCNHTAVPLMAAATAELAAWHHAPTAGCAMKALQNAKRRGCAFNNSASASQTPQSSHTCIMAHAKDSNVHDQLASGSTQCTHVCILCSLLK